MPRAAWKGFIRLSLVSVPVKAYTATSSAGSAISLNQLHAECGSRIKYQKTCPIHGEVGSDEIVSGYEFSKGQYVVIDTDEVQKLRSEDDKAIKIDSLVPADRIDPVYYSGKTYYLIPDGPVGQRPYALIQQSLADDGLQAVAQVVLSGKEQLVLLRPIDQLIAMSVLEYDADVKKPAAFEDELVKSELPQEELKLTKTLLNAYVKEDFDLAAYKDVYTERLAQLIESKVEGKELVSPPSSDEPQVINLMEALKMSVAQVKQAAPAQESAAKKTAPAKKMAPSEKKPRTAAVKKKKSG